MSASQLPTGYIRWIRQQVASRKLLLVFATVACGDEHGRVLLHRRTVFDLWSVPSVALDFGESIVTCDRRELEEVSGVAPVDLDDGYFLY